MSRTLLFNLQSIIVILLVCMISACSKKESPQASFMPAVEVGVLTLKDESMDINVELPGRTSPYAAAEIRPQVNGIILKRMFEEGSVVTAGQQLYQIDPAVYQADYDTAVAQLARSKALVESTSSLAKRYQELLQIDAVSKQEYIDAKARLAESQAEVAVAQAAKQTAQINLNYTKVFSPITGRIGKSSVTEGALVTANQSLPLALVQQLDPIYVDVTQSSTDILKLRQKIENGNLTGTDNKTPVKLILNDINYEYEQTGVLKFSDITVDKETGNIAIRAVFPNPDNKILPGLFVRALIKQAKINHVILVPQQSITRELDGDAVAWVIDDENKVQTVPVELGEAVQDKWIVNNGLTVGQKVIVEGLIKVRVGSLVKPVEIFQKSAELKFFNNINNFSSFSSELKACI